MASIRVFVDDAIKGDLPQVCVHSGIPADVSVQVVAPVGAPSDWRWLLLLFGPIGWVIFFVTGPSRETLIVQLPFASTVVEERRRHAVTRFAAGVAALILFLAGFLTATYWWFTWLSSLVLVIVAVQAHLKVARLEVGVGLDASRRWVTLTGVHENFVAALPAQMRELL